MPDLPGPLPGAPAEFVYHELRRRILDGTIPPGSAISQVKIAAELGVNRSPLREAISRLASEGLVTDDYNRRTRVAALDLDDLDQLYATRMRIEPLAIEATVSELDPAALVELRAHFDGMEEDLRRGEMASFRDHHRAFHLGLMARPPGRISALIAELWDHSDRYRVAYRRYTSEADEHRLREAQEEHRGMLSAAEDGDPARCAALHLAHLARTVEGILHENDRTPRWSARGRM